MPEDDPDEFAFVVEWIYGQPLRLQIRASQARGTLSLCKGYILSDKLGMEDLAERMLSAIRTYLNNRGILDTTYLDIIFAYHNSPELSPLRTTFVDVMVRLYFANIFDSSKVLWFETVSCHPQYHQDVLNEIRTHMLANPSACTWSYQPWGTTCILHPADSDSTDDIFTRI